MRQLYLLRHAKSSWEDPALADRERPLSARGRLAAQAMARHVASTGIAPSLVLCSPALRTRQTLEIIAGSLPADAQCLIEEDLYGASQAELEQRIRLLPPAAQSVLLIGHNPGIHELALRLAGAEAPPRLAAKFPTAALAGLGVPGGWQELGKAPCRLLEFVAPRELMA